MGLGPGLGPSPAPASHMGTSSVLTAPGAVKLRGEAEWQGQCLEQHLGQRRDSEGVGLSNPMTFENSKYYKEMKVTAAHYISKSASPAARRKLPPPVATGAPSIPGQLSLLSASKDHPLQAPLFCPESRAGAKLLIGHISHRDDRTWAPVALKGSHLQEIPGPGPVVPTVLEWPLGTTEGQFLDFLLKAGQSQKERRLEAP